MFRKITLHNFKSFSDIEIDLEGNGKNPLNIAMVYGENGAGKTNIVDSVRFLKDSMGTFAEPGGIEPLLEDLKAVTDMEYAPEDSEGIADAMMTLLTIVRKKERLERGNIQALAADSVAIGSADGMRLSYVFDADGSRTEYSMGFDAEGKLVYENLRSIVGTRTGCYYCIRSEGGTIESKLSESFIPNGAFRTEIRSILERYWGKHSMMAVMCQQYSAKNAEFMAESVSPGFARIRDYLGSVMIGYPSDMPFMDGIHELSTGIIGQSEAGILDAYESALDLFFTSLSPDIRRVWYERRDAGGRIAYGLMFDRMISGTVRTVPYGMESAGIRKLVRLFPLLVGSTENSTVFIDELDSGIHDKMVCELISRISSSVNGQLFFTTHNTQLLEDADPRSAFIIRIDQDGFKSVLPISRISRTQKNHNNRNRYLNGTLGGIPYVGYIDMDAISSILGGARREVG